MAPEYTQRRVSDEERRDFLKALGVSGTAAVGSLTLDDVREALTAGSSTELASVGQDIKADLGGTLDAELLAAQQSSFAERASALESVRERGLPTDEPREEFQQVAAVGRPAYEHLADVGFFESTTENLPDFTPAYLEGSVKAFVGSEALAAPLTELDIDAEAGTDLVATVVTNAERINEHHWIATDEIPRTEFKFGEAIPPMTQGAAGGVLLWLEDLDRHLYQKRILITDEILDNAVWHARSMAAGFQLMTEGAKAIATESGKFSDDELGALLSTGFAVQVIAQNLLPQDVYWITDDMRTSFETADQRLED